MVQKSKKKIAIKEDWYYIIPLAFIIGIVPIIVRFIYIPLDGIAKHYWTGAYDSDLYTYWKMVWMEIASIALIILGYIKLSKNEIQIKKTNYYIPIGIYAFFIILSSMFSQYKDLVVNGFPNRHESVFVVLAYVLIMVAAILLVNTEKHVKIILGTLIGSATLIGILGILQFIGLDFMKSKAFIKAFIIPGMYYRMGDVSVSFDNIGISSTLYNSDFVGSYVAMLLPIAVCLIVYLKNIYQKILMSIFGCLMFAILLGSRSRAGVVGITIAGIILVIMLRKYLIKKWVYVLSLVFLGIIVVVILNHIPGRDKMSNQVALIKKDIQEIFVKNENVNYIQDIKIDNNEATILAKKNPIKFTTDNNQLVFKDINNNVLQQNKQESKDGILITFEKSEFKDYTFTLATDGNTLHAKILGVEAIFKFTSSGIAFEDGMGNVVKLQPIKKIEVGNKGEIGNGRVYIWSRTIPLLENSIFIGYGPGTFAIKFPQNDYVGKLLNGAPRVLIDKPHNWYLETATNTGVISLLALIAFLGMYFVSSLKIYFKNSYDMNYFELTGIGIFAGVSGYLAAAMFNDSVVPVAPVFWILLGLGISINYLVKKKRENDLLVVADSTENKSNIIKKGKKPLKT